MVNKQIKILSILVILIIFTPALIGGCGGSGNNSNDAPPDEDNAELSFVDVTSQAGFNYSHGFISENPSNEPQLVSGGVAAGDYNNDGWIDLYVVRGPAGSNLLFKNNGNGSFVEVGQAAGLNISGTIGSGPTFVDFSGDGFLDLFIGGIFPSVPSFYLNNGDGTFTNFLNVLENDTFNSRNTFSAAFGDYDLDNDLDMLLTHWNGGNGNVMSEHLLQNNGDNTFTDVSLTSGISPTFDEIADFTFTPNFADINNDGYPDILLAADFGTSQVFINQQDGTFINTTDSAVITDENGMGAAIGDYDNDGDLDWFVSSIYDPNQIAEANWGVSGNRLYRNIGDGTFEDVTLEAGVEHGFWGWGACMQDFNNDGYLDIAHVNGFLGIPPSDNVADEYSQDPTRIFISNGDGTFTERAEELGLNDTGQGRGIVCFDYDRDGDIDLFIANNNQPPKLFRNDLTNSNNFINIKLNGLPPNTEGVGSRVIVTTGNKVQMRELRAGSNFVSQDPVVAHYGLGDAELVQELRVNWSDGQISVIENISPNQFLAIDHPNL